MGLREYTLSKLATSVLMLALVGWMEFDHYQESPVVGEVINRSCANDIQVETSSPGLIEIIFILMHIPSCSLI